MQNQQIEKYYLLRKKLRKNLGKLIFATDKETIERKRR